MARDAGFTLIEIILTLVLVGIMATVGGMAVITGMKGYLLARENASITQKAQVALSRLNREMMELVSITSASSTSIVYTRPSGTRSLALVGNQLKIVDGTTLPNASLGDVLIDQVSSIQIEYSKAGTNWVLGTDLIELLSGVRITLVLTRSNASISNPAFTTMVTPRNNGNLGGVEPTVNPPAKANYCFVATAVYGQSDHPAVELLRRFRDEFLARWSAGRAFIDFYYSFGPMLADLIRNRPLACLMGRVILAPLVLLAFLLLYFPAGIPFLLFLCFLFHKVFCAVRGKHAARDRPARLVSNQRGSVLIGLIMTMVILGVLSASILSLTTTSTFEHVAGNSAMRAYFLAESGYRYVAGQFLNAGDETAKDNSLQSLHNQTFALTGNDGRFFLQIYPYYYRTTADPTGTATLSTSVPGGFPPGLTLTNGYLRVNENTYQYRSAAVVGANVAFTLNSGTWPSIPAGKIVRPVCRPNGTQTVNDTTHNYIDVETTTGAINAFPMQNSTFRVESSGQLSTTIYTYMTRTNNRLSGIKASDNSTSFPSFTVNTTTNITGEKFVQLHSTGIFGQGGSYETRREVIYDTPIGYAASQPGPTQKATTTDPMESMGNWFTGSSQGEAGGHSIASVSDSNAMHVTSGQAAGFLGGSSGGYWSWLNFDWSRTSADFQNAWQAAGYLLSYDLQVKIKATNEPYFMAGMSFRTRADDTEDLYTYGVSYLKARKTRTSALWGAWSAYSDRGDIPSAIVPSALFSGTLETGSVYNMLPFGLLRGQDQYSQPAIVLWQRTSAGFKWLAYTILATTDHVVANVSGKPRLADWSTLQVRVVEAIPLSFSNGGSTPPLWGEIISGQTSGASAFVNGTPILTSGSWSSSNAAGTLALYKVTGTFASGENLIVNSQIRGRVAGAQGAKTNYLRVYYADTGTHTPNSTPTDNNRGADPRITASGQTVSWPVDNVSEWASGNDFMTLVQWDGVNTSVTRLGTGSEFNAIIQDSALLSPSSGTSFTSSEVALHTAGGSSSDIPDIYFDDFAVQLIGSSTDGGSTGFLSPIQQ